MALPPMPSIDRYSPPGLELMPHQIRMIESVREGHRTFLLADEPGLGKTAQSVIAASVANAYPMLAVVPNVVKINWAREVERWTPHRRVTVIHGDGVDVDAFADIFVVNYTVLDRHLSWLSTFGFRSMVVDEAHFIKNLTSQRSQHVLALSQQIRDNTPGGDPLLLALTGTPLINDVEDFNAIWRFLGWVKGDQPGAAARCAGSRPSVSPRPTAGFYPEARGAVDRHGHRAPPQGRRRQGPAGQADRRHPRRARRRRGALDPVLGARAGPAAAGELPPAPRRPRGGAGRRPGRRARRLGRGLRGGRRGPHATGMRAGARVVPRQWREGRERLHHGPPDRPGQGSSGGGLHRTAGPFGRQGRLLRQAHRRHGHRRAGPQGGRAADGVDPRRPDRNAAPAGHRRLPEATRTSRSRSARSSPPASASTCTRRPTSSSPSCPGRRPSSSRRSTASTGSVRTSRSRRGGSSPPRRSTARSPSSSTASRVWPHARSTAATRRSAPVTRSSSTRSSTCCARR